MSAIEWTDVTWNPTTGCDRISPGCDHCYAMSLAPRLKGMGSSKYQRDGDPRTSGPGFGVTEHPGVLDQPLRWRKPRRVFVDSMSDLFHDGVSDEFIARVFATMAMAHQHSYQVLTKRHGRMRSLLRSAAFEESVRLKVEHYDEVYERRIANWPLPNVWLGVSVEDQKRADLRVPALLDTPAAVRFLSCEPLLGPVDLSSWLDDEHFPWHYTKYGVSCACGASMRDERCLSLTQTLWVIVGGESGQAARPMHPAWARQLRDECTAAGVPFFFKQWGKWGPVYSHRGWFGGGVWIDDDGATVSVEDPYDLDRHQAAGLQLMQSSRDGKKFTGRALDGRTWDMGPGPVMAHG